MKITKSELKEIIREELLNEDDGKTIHSSNVDGYKVQINYSKERDSVNIYVKDRYPWSIERIPVSVAKELIKGLRKL